MIRTLSRLRPMAERILLGLRLLVGRRRGALIGFDLFVLMTAAIGAFESSEWLWQMFVPVVLMPMLILGLPVVSDSVALELRAGSLDLALTSPGAEGYFERRIFSFCGLLIIQGCLIIVAIRFAQGNFLLFPAIVHVLVSGFVIGATALFWATRLRAPGSVLFASSATLLALSKWLFTSPVHQAEGLFPFLFSRDALPWLRDEAVLLAVGIVLLLYARRRLSRPEQLLF